MYYSSFEALAFIIALIINRKMDRQMEDDPAVRQYSHGVSASHSRLETVLAKGRLYCDALRRRLSEQKRFFQQIFDDRGPASRRFRDRVPYSQRLRSVRLFV